MYTCLLRIPTVILLEHFRIHHLSWPVHFDVVLNISPYLTTCSRSAITYSLSSWQSSLHCWFYFHFIFLLIYLHCSLTEHIRLLSCILCHPLDSVQSPSHQWKIFWNKRLAIWDAFDDTRISYPWNNQSFLRFFEFVSNLTKIKLQIMHPLNSRFAEPGNSRSPKWITRSKIVLQVWRFNHASVHSLPLRAGWKQGPVKHIKGWRKLHPL